jgi:Ca2+/H+ antiporter, TMEM165/GDT1 family
MSGGLVILATFLAAAVEWVEALTIVLAVGMFKSWRIALVATVAAFVALVAIVLVFGFAITSHISLGLVRTFIGVGLLLFGLGWLYKAILRSTGLKALHDEGAVFAETREELMTHGHAFGTAFGGVFLEGLEVVFIVVALGGLNSLLAAATGAVISLVVVIAAGVVLRHPLTRVPENAVKYAVGIMLTSFGTFFAGEGLGVSWWHDDIVLLPLIAVYAGASLAFVQGIRWRARISTERVPGLKVLQAVVREVWGLFVTDGLLALLAVIVLLGVAILMDKFSGQRPAAALVLVAGVVISIGASLWSSTRRVPPRSTPAVMSSVWSAANSGVNVAPVVEPISSAALPESP